MGRARAVCIRREPRAIWAVWRETRTDPFLLDAEGRVRTQFAH